MNLSAFLRLLVLSLVLSACAITDDRAQPVDKAPNPTASAYVVSSYNDNGSLKQEWQVAKYSLGKFPPRVEFTDPATGKRMTVTGSFTVDDVTLPK